MSKIDPSQIEPIELPEPDLPEPSPEELLREQIEMQDDAVQILVRPLKNNPTSLFSEEIVQSEILGKAVKLSFEYEDVYNDKDEFVGRCQKNTTLTETSLQTIEGEIRSK
jgi:hypothetical protein